MKLLSYIGIISLEFYTLEFCIYAFMTVGIEDNTEDSGSIQFPAFCSFFPLFSSMLLQATGNIAKATQTYKINNFFLSKFQGISQTVCTKH